MAGIAMIAAALATAHTQTEEAELFIVVFGIAFAVHAIVAQGCRKRQSWARYASIVIALLMLVGVPIGTVFGLYLLRNTWHRWSPLAA